MPDDDANVAEVARIFENAGLNISIYDTVPNAFNLNKNYLCVENVACYREYGFCLPAVLSVDDFVRIVEMEHAGLVEFLVYKE